MREKRVVKGCCFVAWILLLSLILPAGVFAKDEERNLRREGSYQNDFPKASQRETLPPVRSQRTVEGETAPAGVGGLVAINSEYSSIKTVNPRALTLSQRLLDGQMEGIPTELHPNPHGGGLFDAIVTPDGKTAVVSNFGSSIVYFLDLSNPASPAILGNAPIKYDTGTVDKEGKPIVYGFFAEDMALTPDGRYLLVTDGGLQRPTRKKAVLERENRSIGVLARRGVGGNKRQLEPDLARDLNSDLRSHVFVARIESSADVVGGHIPDEGVDAL